LDFVCCSDFLDVCFPSFFVRDNIYSTIHSSLRVA
jgi:hypothetical protein